ncbi:MAG: ABC transporter ATP-binding protein [Sulfurovum sp.]|nr:ABC transporter ATP-binding protein [Sulfurovum sp.]
MIRLKGVTKYYPTKSGRNYILKNVSFDMPSKCNIAILGRNGAGKSTLMRMLGYIEFPNSGEILSDYTFSWPLGLGGGFVGNMTGKANVKFVCRLYGKSKDEIKAIASYVKEFSELGKYFDMPIRTYSSGMRGRLSFGLSLAFDFDYMLIDETLSVGDTRFKKKSKEALMKKIEQSSVLLVSHDVKTVKEICDSGIILDQGKLNFHEDVSEAIEAYETINKQPASK